jgi:hypothetical protein
MKNKGKILTAAGISGLLMAGGVLSASASTSGYDTFKTAVKKTYAVNSFTAHVQGSLTDNGKVIYQVDSVNKEDVKTHATDSLTNVINNGIASQFSINSLNHQEVMENSKDNVYYVRQGNKNGHENMNHKEGKPSAQVQQGIENIFDALTKNYQDKIQLTDLSNGNKELQLSLSKTEVPVVGQAVASFLITNANQHSDHFDKGKFGQKAELKPTLPQLTSNVSVDSVELKGIVDAQQFLVGQEVTLNVSGDDAKGTHHNLVLHLTDTLNNINSTTVKAIDLKGKKVVKVQDRRNHQD